MDATMRVRYSGGGLRDRALRRPLPAGEAFRVHIPSSPDARTVEVILERRAELRQELAESDDELGGLVAGYSVEVATDDIRTKCSPLPDRHCRSVSFDFFGHDPSDDDVRQGLSAVGVVLDHIGDCGGFGSTVRLLYFWFDGEIDPVAVSDRIRALYGPVRTKFEQRW
ncbi:hypothetical protein PX52LOC_06997 [Limnoglobus roseus]|uniref:Uncharacterized protein n=2 Tax=Limnoglobus roseus TaxID=2598579 RepID=A0A5C1AMW6_9BACT|nr:hypothetical protein PX52LOC_06997 [Limnoglobus roseus]